jgi:hypothetical protein
VVLSDDEDVPRRKEKGKAKMDEDLKAMMDVDDGTLASTCGKC